MKKTIILGLVLICIFLAGCSSDVQYEAPSKVGADSAEEAPTETVETIPAEPEAEPEPPKVQEFKVGETATDNQLEITLNSVEFVSNINEQDNQFLVAEAPSGKEYVVIDITIKNILTDSTQMVSTFGTTTLVDQDGYNYDLDFEGFSALEKTFKDGEILPGMKKRGDLAYLVPSDATDLKFLYRFDLFEGATAVFDIK